MTKLSKYVDHTVLAATATPADVKKLAAEAKEHDFFSVCINPAYVPLAKAELENSDVKVCTVNRLNILMRQQPCCSIHSDGTTRHSRHHFLFSANAM